MRNYAGKQQWIWLSYHFSRWVSSVRNKQPRLVFYCKQKQQQNDVRRFLPTNVFCSDEPLHAHWLAVAAAQSRYSKSPRVHSCDANYVSSDLRRRMAAKHVLIGVYKSRATFPDTYWLVSTWPIVVQPAQETNCLQPTSIDNEMTNWFTLV